MSKWIEVRKSGNYEEIGLKHGISPVLARILKNRNIETDAQIEKYLHGGYKDLYNPHLLKDVDKGAKIIKEKIESGEPIRIIGDYDIDGVQATYILYKGLSRCGAIVDYAIPHRIEDGYGINQRLIENAHNDGITTIITCDNGIAAIDAIKYAKNLGMACVVTDHHDIPYEILSDGSIKYKENPADAVINPKQNECPYPFKGLCGAGVAYKFICVLYELFGISEEESKAFIENAGFATVGDVMDLVDENRILVKIGLSQLRATQNLGMQALIEVNNLDYLSINSYHIGFILGPCINASGRLDTALQSIQLLLEEDREKASVIAQSLLEYNNERKNLTQEGVEKAIELIETSDIKDDRVLVVYLEDCHESIAGIIAGRIRERYYKPVFILTDAESGIKGSGRSIEEYSMYDEMVKCSSFLTKFGGHPMAAGLSLSKENIEPFRKAMNQNCTLTDVDLVEKVKIDVVLPIEYITKDLINQLELLEPCGKGNTKPVFAARNISVTSAKILGKSGNAVKLGLNVIGSLVKEGMVYTDGESFMQKMAEKFGDIEKDLLLEGKAQHSNLHVLYYPTINEWNGRTSLQITIKDVC